MSDLFRYKLTIEYDGANYHGWQMQENVPSIQRDLEEAAFKFCQCQCRFHGAGRTDAGVHAIGMIAHVDIPRDLEAFKVMDALNFHLKGIAISILKAERVDEEFHARFSAKKRHYRYHIINRRAKLSLLRGKAWQIKEKLDVEKRMFEELKNNHEEERTRLDIERDFLENGFQNLISSLSFSSVSFIVLQGIKVILSHP
mgnify:CR=1 FL=1